MRYKFSKGLFNSFELCLKNGGDKSRGYVAEARWSGEGDDVTVRLADTYELLRVKGQEKREEIKGQDKEEE